MAITGPGPHLSDGSAVCDRFCAPGPKLPVAGTALNLPLTAEATTCIPKLRLVSSSHGINRQGSMNRFLLATCVSFSLAGCELLQPTPKPATKNLSSALDAAPIGRFAVTSDASNTLALDTKTGLACKTWNWSDADSNGNGKFRVTAQTGKVYEFDTQGQADAFRKAAKIGRSDPLPLCADLLINEEKVVQLVRASSSDSLSGSSDDFDWKKDFVPIQNADPRDYVFSVSRWKKGNPNGDVNAAIAEAKKQGYEVVQ